MFGVKGSNAVELELVAGPDCSSMELVTVASIELVEGPACSSTKLATDASVVTGLGMLRVGTVTPFRKYIFVVTSCRKCL
jgi:hypothetical protein